MRDYARLCLASLSPADAEADDSVGSPIEASGLSCLSAEALAKAEALRDFTSVFGMPGPLTKILNRIFGSLG